MQSSSYTHFTSPIRRYPDLIIHRILKGRAYEGGELSSMASILSESERNAAAAEARSYEIKALRWLGERPDAVYDGIVIRIDLNSVSVELIDYKVRGRAYFKKIGVNIRSLFPGALVKAKVLFTEPLFGYAEMEITDERNNV